MSPLCIIIMEFGCNFTCISEDEWNTGQLLQSLRATLQHFKMHRFFDKCLFFSLHQKKWNVAPTAVSNSLRTIFYLLRGTCYYLWLHYHKIFKVTMSKCQHSLAEFLFWTARNWCLPAFWRYCYWWNRQSLVSGTWSFGLVLKSSIC